MGDTLDYKPFVRKPFTVEAVEVTKENIEQIAPMIGRLAAKPDGNLYIEVDPAKVPHVKAVYTGFYVTKMGKKIHCYSKKAFFKQFIEPYDGLMDWLNSLDQPAEG